MLEIVERRGMLKILERREMLKIVKRRGIVNSVRKEGSGKPVGVGGGVRLSVEASGGIVLMQKRAEQRVAVTP